MNYKKKIIISSIFFILIIQILLLINNKQKTYFRYFIWTVEEVSIGKLICLSFVSGLVMSTLLTKTLHKNVKSYQKHEDNNRTSKNNFSLDDEETNDSNEIPPERDMRDTQPTISVNYRVIKDNGDNEFKDRKQTSNKNQYQDDWNFNDTEW